MSVMFYLMFMFLAIQGSSAFRCDEIRKCDDKYSSVQELSDLGFTPNQEQLARLCPGTLRFFECYFEQVLKCMSLSIPELAKRGHDFALKILNTRNLIVDICNDDSTLHKEYVTSIDCIQDITSAQSPVCRDNKEKLVKEFLESRSPLDVLWTVGENNLDDQSCLESVYSIACLAEDIKRNCGSTARRVYLTVLEHSRIAAPSECINEDDLILKLEFLEYLKLKEDEKNDYWSVFQALRR